jgi:hypothetical protein
MEPCSSFKDGTGGESPFAETKPKGRFQYTESINNASPEIDGRRVLEILCRAADLAYTVAEPYDLRQHLVVKNKII